ncbi:MAG: hypothetical protein GAK31_00283 [Stenotrophomonas maltophilia]|uniref:DUF4124 domain-containing protein n=1 Tax=Stenotrophomonas maltophilia TaxID=40324 RepID=A0A7V8JN25_STEMA|nr:MAG: hypothetical protein GAK31_00283 [Stenotrophomonas maltophilia]
MDVRITAAVLLALLLPAQAMAQRVYKCAEKEGTVYQSTPCASRPEQKS